VSVSPFVYERPIDPDAIIGRANESQRLLDLAEAGRYVALVAPRRWGKTSLLRRLLADSDRRGQPGVLVDFYGVVSLAEATHRIERAYAAALHGPLRTVVERFFSASGLGLSLGAFGISASLERARNTDPLPALHALLDLPMRVMARSGVIPVVVFDEFQDLLPVANMDAIVRSHIQHHGGNVAYVFSGSEPGMMRQLFDVKSRPLYGQAVQERLGRLRDSDIARYVTDRFEATDKDVGEMIVHLLRTADGHPQRAMLLADHLWQETGVNDAADDLAWEHAINRVDLAVDAEFRALWRSLETSEARALRALTISGGEPYRASALSSVDLKKSTARDAYERLIDRGELERPGDEDHLRFVDPLFQRWVAGESTAR
jgi:uncharacterized protein